MNKRYHVRKFSYYLCTIFAFLVPLIMLLLLYNYGLFTFKSQELLIMLPILAPAFIFSLFTVYLAAIMSKFIEINIDNTIRFVSIKNNILLNIKNLKRVRANASQPFLFFEFDNKKLILLNDIINIKDLLSDLKNINNNIEIEGL